MQLCGGYLPDGFLKRAILGVVACAQAFVIEDESIVDELALCSAVAQEDLAPIVEDHHGVGHYVGCFGVGVAEHLDRVHLQMDLRGTHPVRCQACCDPPS